MKEQSFYMAMPRTQREKLREKQKLHTYREYTKNLTSVKVNTQMDAESEYLIRENRLLYKRLTQNDAELLDITPEDFLLLADLAEKMQERFRKDLTVMKYETLIAGREHFRTNPPVRKSNQISQEVESLIVKMAMENLTWGSPHILYSMRSLGFTSLKEHHVMAVLRKNHIPTVVERVKKGLPWRDFVKMLKDSKCTGVIYL